jgi:hypothetical protein
LGYDAIPQSLRARAQWLVWRFEDNGEKKPRKVPYYAANHRRVGEQGTPEDRAKLRTLDQAIAAAAKLHMDGIGFAFLSGDGLIGIDIDGAIDTGTGEVAERARTIIEACNSYTEYSPSGKGVHIIVAGESSTFKSNKIGLEVFCGSQFFTFTGNRYSGTPDEVREISPAILGRLRATVDEAKGNRRLKAVPGEAKPALPGEVNREELESALSAISPDLEYEDWIHVGMALCHVYGPAAGLDMWDRWSSASSKYPGRGSLETHWKSWSGGVSTVTQAKIFMLANATGWRWKRKRTPLRAIEGGKKSSDTPSKRSAKTDPEKPKKRPKEFWDQVNGLSERFTLIYGTDTAYDHVKRKIIKVANMRIAFGKDPVNFWLAGRDRRMVDQDNVVFDPTGKAQLPDHVNLFYGMQLAPDRSKPCQKILELLNHLCNEEEAVFEWVLKWIAYPLQHPGAKMESAIVMHGEEGLGKNFFWKVVSFIYRDYATVITQNELESQFNTWSSRKLFMVANEVVSRSELREHKGRLKNYITETELQINEKLLPLRTERNHMNFVFLSNETQPLALDRTDRRYLVIWTPPVAQPKEFYDAVGDELDGGGAAGLYAHLLAMDLEDFNEHTKPILTEAKRNLIEISKAAPELFYDQWAGGLLPVRFISALAADLYRSFTKWCSINGEKHPPSETKFGSAMRRLGVKRDRDWLAAGQMSTKKRYLTYYTVPVPAESPLFGLALERLVSEFSQDLESWQRGEGYSG